MKCSNCGKNVKVSHKFCPACGQEIVIDKAEELEKANKKLKAGRTMGIIGLSISFGFLALLVLSIAVNFYLLTGILFVFLSIPCILASLILSILGIVFTVKGRKAGSTGGGLATSILGIVLSFINLLVICLIGVLLLYLYIYLIAFLWGSMFI